MKYLLYIWCFLIITPGFARVYVDGRRTGGDGSSWQEAYRTVEEAIRAAGPGQEIWVADGIYQPSQPLNLKEGMRLYGGFNGTETSFDQRKVMQQSAVIDGRGSLVHVLEISQKAKGCVVDGFHIRGGNATGSFGWNSYGGNHMGELSVSNCYFKGNESGSVEGGVYSHYTSIFLHDSTFRNNRAKFGGGVMLDYKIPGHTSILERCVFSGNSATSEGGGFIVMPEALLLITQFSHSITPPTEVPYVFMRACLKMILLIQECPHYSITG
jgi:hypothetical protein